MTVRELRNRGGEVLDRVLRGESLVVTRDGVPVGELRPRGRRSPRAVDLVAPRARLPRVYPAAFRVDVDAVVDAGL